MTYRPDIEGESGFEISRIAPREGRRPRHCGSAFLRASGVLHLRRRPDNVASACPATTPLQPTSQPLPAPADRRRPIRRRRSTTAQTTMTAAGDAALPEQVAYVPMAKPGKPAFPVDDSRRRRDDRRPDAAVAQQPAQTAQQTDAAPQKIAAADAGVTAPKPTAAAPATNNPVYVTAGDAPQADRAQEKGFLASLFGTTPASAAPAPLINARVGRTACAVAAPRPQAGKADRHAGLGQCGRKAGAAGFARRRQQPHHAAAMRCPACARRRCSRSSANPASTTRATST